MNVINASELKTRGAIAIEMALKNESDAVISVRGQSRYVVMDIDYYQKLREFETECAVRSVKADIEAGRFVDETAQQHAQRMIEKYGLSTADE